MISDAELYTDIMNKLRYEPTISSAEITIAVHNAVVTIAGKVASYFERHAVETAVSSVYGVMAIANELQVSPPEPFRLNDTQIAEIALAALNANVAVSQQQIKLTVENGRVSLHGTVNWWFQRQAAEKAVRNLIGVKDVNNHIVIKSSLSPTAVREQIAKEFARNAEIDARRVRVEAKNGQVTLSGAVRSVAEMKEAVRAAWSVAGVEQVSNQLRITP